MWPMDTKYKQAWRGKLVSCHSIVTVIIASCGSWHILPKIAIYFTKHTDQLTWGHILLTFPLCLPLEWSGVCCSPLVQVLCVSEQRRVKAPAGAGWGSRGESVQDRTKSLKVGLVINGIDQPVNPGVYILHCLHSPIATVLNWACSKQPP